MNKLIQCPCGYVIRDEAEKSLVQKAQRHAKETHGMELTAKQALEMARPE